MTQQAPAPLLRVIDLETTGNNFGDGGVVEIGWQDVAPTADGWALHGPPGARLVNPGHPITPATSAIHHLVDEDVAGQPGWPQVAPDVLRASPGPAPWALAAHRAAFEQRWCLPSLSGGARWICTYKCALRLWPDAPSHSNQGLRYWRKPAGLDRQLGLPAHRAGPDAYVTAHHLRDMLALADVAQLLAWSAEPALLVRVPFGPLRGRRWRDLTDEALDGFLTGTVAGGASGKADILFTARTERARRTGLAPSEAAPAMEQPPQADLAL